MNTCSFFSKKSNFLCCLKDIKKQIDNKFGKYDFLIFSIHSSFNSDNINRTIYEIFNTSNFIAFNTINYFIDNNIIRGGVGVYAIKFERKGNIKTFFIDSLDKSNIQKVADYLNNNKDDFHLIFAAYKNIYNTNFINNISEKLNYSPINNIAGGVASGYKINRELRCCFFVNDAVLKEGVAIVSFENVKAEIGVSLGFKPYGITYKITKAKDNKLYTVDDDKSASYIFSNLLKGIDNPDIRYLWYVPIYVLNENNSDISAIRTIKDIKKDYVEFFANLNEGEYFKLSFSTYKDLLAENKRVAKSMINRLKNPEFSFLFSCVARQYVLEDHQQDEIEIYSKTFNTHLFGFSTFGEVASCMKYKKLKFCNESSIAVIMKEK
ncbi:hypothetical protein JCM11957_04050 [Caminibacter profundus]